MTTLPTYVVNKARSKPGQRMRWPWKFMEPGDSIDVIVDPALVRHVRAVAGSHCRSDGSVRMRTETMDKVLVDEAGNPDAEGKRYSVRLRVYCDPFDSLSAPEEPKTIEEWLAMDEVPRPPALAKFRRAKDKPNLVKAAANTRDGYIASNGLRFQVDD